MGSATFGFGEHIHELRRALDLTLTELGGRAGLDPHVLEEIEAGARDPSLEELLALGQGIGARVSTILRLWEAKRGEAGLPGR